MLYKQEPDPSEQVICLWQKQLLQNRCVKVRNKSAHFFMNYFRLLILLNVNFISKIAEKRAGRHNSYKEENVFQCVGEQMLGNLKAG